VIPISEHPLLCREGRKVGLVERFFYCPCYRAGPFRKNPRHVPIEFWLEASQSSPVVKERWPLGRVPVQ